MKSFYFVYEGNGHFPNNDLISDEELFEAYEADEDTTLEDVSMESYLRSRDNNDGAVLYIAEDWGMELKHVDDMIQCPICGGRMTFMGGCKINDVYQGADGFGDDAIIQDYICLECGRLISISDPKEDEKRNTYKGYWGTQDEDTSGFEALLELKKKLDEM